MTEQNMQSTRSSIGRRFICIVSPAYSGSTLVALMAGAHPSALYIGEFHAFPHWVKQNLPCGCGSVIRNCEFWRDVLRRYKQDTGIDMLTNPERSYLSITHNETRNKTVLRLQKAIQYFNILYNPFLDFSLPGGKIWMKSARETLCFYDHIVHVAESTILVDSTKNPLRAYSLYRQAPENMYVLLLVRDGRGVCYSNKIRHGTPIIKSAKFWKNYYKRATKIISRLPKEQVIHLNYENICKQPAKEMKKLANFLSIQFNSSMLDPSKGLGHSIAGNNMKWETTRGIELNEKWKGCLSSNELNSFELIAGPTNRLLGYTT
jgi:hypothetical protein